MAGKLPVSNDDLYEIATYLAQAAVETEIHAELLHKVRKQFEAAYRNATDGLPLPRVSKKGPYYVWPEGTNKYGRQLRIYFKPVSPKPSLIKKLYTDNGKWYARKNSFRINHSALGMQLFECGFVLGSNKGNQQRINEFLKRKFPFKHADKLLWTRDELILVLDAYFSCDNHSSKDPKVLELSEFLENLPYHGKEAKVISSRSPDSVSMKLMNFRLLDQKHEDAELHDISEQDRIVWDEFAHKRSDLRATAHAIRQHAQESQTLEMLKISEWLKNTPVTEACEGQILTRVHLVRERNQKLVDAKKKSVLEKTGRLVCEACGFDFVEKYGKERGQGFIECHHNKPLHSLKPGSETHLDDLSLLCSNCHRMIHVKQPWLEIDELIRLLDMMSEI